MKVLLLFLVLESIISCQGEAPALQTGKGIEERSLPTFDILLMDSITKVNTGKILGGKSIVLFFFGPNCPYCQALSKDIIIHIDKFKNERIFLLSSAPFREIKTYDTLFKLNKYPNITIGQDYTGAFFNYFKGKGIPYLVIYDKNKNYKQTVLGRVGADSILTIINR